MAKVRTGALLLLGTLMVPCMAHAQVVISEIAWMGTAAASNGHYCEWIELHNQGSENVSLSGWRLSTADGGMNLTLTGTIQANDFFLVERYTANACPDPVSGISDLSIPFGSGLANGGEILVLTSGSTQVDRIDASGGWEDSVGGDADEKYTAQRSGEGWVTAEPTPGAINATASVATEEPSSSSSSSSKTSSKTVSNPVAYLLIDAGEDRVVSTHAHTRYEGLVYDSKSRLRQHAYVTWAFGDGDRGIGREVEHQYVAEGEYLVVVRAADQYSHGTKSFTVLVDDAEVRVSATSTLGTILTNDNDRVVDLSRWVLEAKGKRYRLPEDTSLLPGRSVLFPASVTGLSTSTPATLLYPDGSVASVLATSTQPAADLESSLLLKEVEPLLGNQVPFSHDTALIAPPIAVDPAVGGARTVSGWLDQGTYRRLSLRP